MWNAVSDRIGDAGHPSAAPLLWPDVDPDPVPAQPAEEPRLHACGHLYDAVDLRLRQYLRVAMQGGEELAVFQGHVDSGDRAEGLGGGAEHIPQLFHTARLRITGCGLRICRGEDGVRVTLAHLSKKGVRVRKQIGL